MLIIVLIASIAEYSIIFVVGAPGVHALFVAPFFIQRTSGIEFCFKEVVSCKLQTSKRFLYADTPLGLQ